MTISNDTGPTSCSFVSQRLKLHYLDWGNAGAPPLILVHGGRDHARSWDRIARALRDEWHVIAVDLRGHGDSAWSPDGAYTMPYFVCDLAKLIEEQGDGPVSIVAHSLGGAISVRYAGMFPERVRKLVAIEGLGLSARGSSALPTPSFADSWRDWVNERRDLGLRERHRYTTIEAAVVRMHSKNKHLSEEQARHLTVHGVNQNDDGTYSWKFDDYMRPSPSIDMADADLRDLWGRIECPTLLAYGNDSWASNPTDDGRAAHFKSARVVTYDNAGHWLHHDQYDKFLADLREFL